VNGGTAVGFKLDPELEKQILAMPGVTVSGPAVLPADGHPAPKPKIFRQPSEAPPSTPPAVLLPPDPFDGMNKVERAYAECVLAPALAAGAIRGWKYESHNFRIADRTWFLPDFEVLCGDLSLELVEIKALWGNGKFGWKDDAIVKWKACRELYPWYRWRALAGRKKGSIWTWEEWRG
jgi:hypothetical protein